MDDTIGSVVSSGSMARRSASASLSPSSPDESPHLEPIMTDVKILPSDYSECEFPDLVDLIARMLAQLIAINVVSPLYQKSHLQDQLPISPDRLTRFHSRATPQISVTDYLNRMVRYSSLEKASLLAAVYYIDLLSQRFPAFTLSSLTVHRFLITAVTVASKGLCDAFCTNTHYAKVGGIGVAELNMLELEFLKRVEWLIVPEPTVLEAYYRSMVAQDPRYRLESEANDISLHPDGTS